MTFRQKHVLGRDAEVEVVEQLVGALPEHGGALVVVGEAGIGKSALLGVARACAVRNGFAVLETSGVQSEAHLAFAGLHQLLRPALGELDRLPVRQRDAVEAAFGLGDSAAPDTFFVALAALDLLAEMAAKRPLLLLVEDAHWLDTATCDVLAFAARRVELEPLVVVITVRDGFDGRLTRAGLPMLRLTGLDEDAAAALLDGNAPNLGPELRQRVLSDAAGNPLALEELPRALAADSSAALSPQAPLPLTERLERAFASYASELPDRASAPLLVAALDQEGDLPHVLEAASALAGRRVDLGDLAPVVDAGLASVDESGIRFRHPLIRSAIYQHASLADRQASHTALAAAYEDDPDRSVWHRAAALVAPDDSVVDELEEAAARARRRGAPSAAAVALRRAAQLTNHTPRRATLLIGAAELEHEIGHHDIALRTVQEARWLDLDHPTRLRVAFLLETLESRWSGSEKVSAFVDLAEELGDAGEADQALRALATVAMRCWWGNPEQTTRERVVAVAERLATPEREPLGLAVLALADPINRGRLVLERLARPEAVELDDPLAMYMLGTAATSVWAHNLGLPFLAAAVDGFRAQGRLGLLAQALVSSAWAAVHVADARVATPAAAEGARLADETGQPRWAAAALLAQATMVAERGDPEAAEELTARAERVLLPMGANPMLSLVQFARGRAAIAQARHTDAYEHLSRIYDPADVAFHPFVGGWAAGDFIDAAARGGGELAVARDVLGHHERMTELTGAPLLRIQMLYVRPLLASDDEAETLFQAALEDRELASWRCYRGRLLLAYGAWLRRQRRVAESRVPLRVAAETFDALGFVGMSERARQELRASGETSRPRVPEAWDQLSPQELQIAQMAAEGLTNREIGAKLYLSHRTIGSHLYRVFPKLGITSRAQLGESLAKPSTPPSSVRRAQSSD